MKTTDAVQFFGTKVRVAKACGRVRSTVSEWDEEPPLDCQIMLELASNGALRASVPEHFEAWARQRVLATLQGAA